MLFRSTGSSPWPSGSRWQPGRKQRAQVVRDAARPDDQHALVAQRHECLAERIMPFGRGVGGDRELDDGDIRVGIYQGQWKPCAMVEPALRSEEVRVGKGGVVT